MVIEEQDKLEGILTAFKLMGWDIKKGVSKKDRDTGKRAMWWELKKCIEIGFLIFTIYTYDWVKYELCVDSWIDTKSEYKIFKFDKMEECLEEMMKRLK